MFATCSVSAHVVYQRLKLSGLSKQLPFGFSWQCHIEKDSYSDGPNNIAGCKNGTMSYQTSSGSACCILMWLYMCLKALKICTSPACIPCQHRYPVLGVMAWVVIGYTTCTYLVWINGNLNANQCISDILWLCPIFEACQTSCFNKIMQNDTLHIVFWSFSMHKVFDCNPGQYNFLCHGLLRWLESAWKDCPFPSLKPSSTPYLTGKSHF